MCCFCFLYYLGLYLSWKNTPYLFTCFLTFNHHIYSFSWTPTVFTKPITQPIASKNIVIFLFFNQTCLFCYSINLYLCFWQLFLVNSTVFIIQSHNLLHQLFFSNICVIYTIWWYIAYCQSRFKIPKHRNIFIL